MPHGELSITHQAGVPSQVTEHFYKHMPGIVIPALGRIEAGGSENPRPAWVTESDLVSKG